MDVCTRCGLECEQMRHRGRGEAGGWQPGIESPLVYERSTSELVIAEAPSSSPCELARLGR